MKQFFFVFLFLVSFSSLSKEWNSMQQFRNKTGLYSLPETDWLQSDRKRNTLIWRNANAYNLLHSLPKEYVSIKQRRDFYAWFNSVIEAKGHEIVWPRMAHYISNKLRLIKAFPYNIFTKKSIKDYAYQGSETVFNNAFVDLKALYLSEVIIKGKQALSWDKNILLKEQQEWIVGIYQSMDEKSLQTIERMAKGKGFYGIMVAKEVRFKGDISNSSKRYNYALYILRDYCKKHNSKF